MKEHNGNNLPESNGQARLKICWTKSDADQNTATGDHCDVRNLLNMPLLQKYRLSDTISSSLKMFDRDSCGKTWCAAGHNI